jgi:hypothetical protein
MLHQSVLLLVIIVLLLERARGAAEGGRPDGVVAKEEGDKEVLLVRGWGTKKKRENLFLMA